MIRAASGFTCDIMAQDFISSWNPGLQGGSTELAPHSLMPLERKTAEWGLERWKDALSSLGQHLVFKEQSLNLFILSMFSYSDCDERQATFIQHHLLFSVLLCKFSKFCSSWKDGTKPELLLRTLHNWLFLKCWQILVNVCIEIITCSLHPQYPTPSSRAATAEVCPAILAPTLPLSLQSQCLLYIK